MLRLNKDQMTRPGRRFVAGFVDHFPIMFLILNYFIAWVIHLITDTPIKFESLPAADIPGALPVVWWFIGFWAIASLSVYPIMVITNVILLRYTRASIGKHLLALTVVRKDEVEMNFKQVLLREVVGKFLAAIPLGFGFLGILFDEHRQTLYDKMVHTYVFPREYMKPSGSPTRVHGENIVG
ncbi:RDD family protein [Patescibacteria group bacterium]